MQSLIFLFFCLFGLIVNICAYICLYNDREEEFFDLAKKGIKFCCIGLVVAILFLFIPTKQTMLLMGGTYLGKKAVNAVVTDEKIQKVDTIINLQLDKYIKELQRGN